jgi:hypothetical protein
MGFRGGMKRPQDSFLSSQSRFHARLGGFVAKRGRRLSITCGKVRPRPAPRVCKVGTVRGGGRLPDYLRECPCDCARPFQLRAVRDGSPQRKSGNFSLLVDAHKNARDSSFDDGGAEKFKLARSGSARQSLGRARTREKDRLLLPFLLAPETPS